MYSLMSRKEIRDFNRLFEPNAFNTGPPIPTLLTAQAGRSASPLYLPELTSSPASSSSSLSLEDDEIRKIFSDPRFDPLPLVNPGDTQVDGSANVYAARGSWNSTICYGSTGEELNPKAAPFVPSFLMSANLHNPQTTRQTSLFFPPEPQYTLAPLDLAGLFTHLPIEHSSLLQPMAQPLEPLAPPGLTHPSVQAREMEVQQESNLTTDAEAEQPVSLPPAYQPVLVDALKPTATARDRQVLLRFIIQYVEQWDMIALLELADRVTIAAFGSQEDYEKEEGLSACDAVRRRDLGITESIADETPEGDSPEEVVAIVVSELYQQFTSMQGAEVANSFAWDVRELILRRFICSFDAALPDSITSYSTTHNAPPSATYVRSSLALCKAIASLYRRDMITRDHISMCISILLKDLKSVEHLEALSLLVLGCGMSFWDVPRQSAEDGNPTAEEAQLQLNVHVKEFLNGLEANLLGRGLDDHTSLLDQTWGNGRCLERVKEVVDAVKGWEAKLVRKMLDDQAEALVATSA